MNRTATLNVQQDLFGDTYVCAKRLNETEGIKYAGSKLKIIPHIAQIIANLDCVKVLDGFSGSTRVSQFFAKCGFSTYSNDISIWSEIFAKTYLLNSGNKKHYQEIIDHLNATPGFYGWFSENYGGEGDHAKKPFQLKNTMRLDGIRQEIDNMHLNEIDRCVALTSLILAMDAVDSTLGHFSSYLSKWSARSYKDMYMRLPQLFDITSENHVSRQDIFDKVENDSFDLAYFDPPYGSNNEKMPPSRVRYDAYYHIWKTVILNDKPSLFGKVNRREDSRDGVNGSVFEEYKKDENGHFIAMEAIRQLIRKTNAHYILLSYSSDGRATREQLNDILNSEGKLIKTSEIDYRTNVMGSMRWTNEWAKCDSRTCEYLFLLEK